MTVIKNRFFWFVYRVLLTYKIDTDLNFSCNVASPPLLYNDESRIYSETLQYDLDVYEGRVN